MQLHTLEFPGADISQQLISSPPRKDTKNLKSRSPNSNK